jgi:hypothetical protein
MTEYAQITREIISLTAEWENRLASLPYETITQRRNSQNRTIKQILGHLIDSASNNIHRMVHLQYQPSPLTFPNYASFGNNDRWISIQDYQGEDWMNMIQLWKYSLLHICHVINNLNEDKLDNEWISGPDQRLTLRSMIVAFLEHLNLHLSEINYLITNNK